MSITGSHITDNLGSCAARTHAEGMNGGKGQGEGGGRWRTRDGRQGSLRKGEKKERTSVWEKITSRIRLNGEGLQDHSVIEKLTIFLDSRIKISLAF